MRKNENTYKVSTVDECKIKGVDLSKPNKTYSLIEVSLCDSNKKSSVGINVSLHPKCAGIEVPNKINDITSKIVNGLNSEVILNDKGVLFEIVENYFDTEKKEYYQSSVNAPKGIADKYEAELQKLASMLSMNFHKNLHKNMHLKDSFSNGLK